MSFEDNVAEFKTLITNKIAERREKCSDFESGKTGFMIHITPDDLSCIKTVSGRNMDQKRDYFNLLFQECFSQNKCELKLMGPNGTLLALDDNSLNNTWQRTILITKDALDKSNFVSKAETNPTSVFQHRM